MRLNRKLLPLKNKYIFLRHGQTKYNIEGKYMGRIDEPLTEEGIEQSRNVTLNQKVDLIYSSPLIRARQTADIIGKKYGLNIIYDERLIEKHGGTVEGIEFDYIMTKHPEKWKVWERKDLNDTISTAYPQGESYLDVIVRVHNLIIEIERENEGMSILFISHHGVLIALRYLFGFSKSEMFENNISNCHLETFN